MASDKRVYELKANVTGWDYTLASGKQISLRADGKTSYETADPLEIQDLDANLGEHSGVKRGEAADTPAKSSSKSKESDA